MSAALALPWPAATQQQAPPTPPAQEPAGNLKITVIEGENAVNNIKSKTATQPVVEVRDEGGKPVFGADVVFRLPSSGPGGVFTGWLTYQVMKTDADGRAAATGMTPNDQPGRFNIKVTATLGKQTGTAIIAQNNSAANPAGASKSHTKLYIVLGAIGVAALAGGLAAHSAGGSSTPPATTPVSISAGAITVGGPH
ncbi:MAG TPA: hypothetical protein VGS58_17795 [Candidatus Sulfopaludibacter sp.]|nr:hypothetical protein [Candidatus Sulfopaludibacter sp.]